MSEIIEIKAMENGPLLIAGKATFTDTDKKGRRFSDKVRVDLRRSW